MSHMSAIAYAETGPTDVLRMTEQPMPVPGPGEVLVRVHRSGLNPSDTKSRSGWGGMTMPGPLVIPNNDGAGVIEAVGAGVDPARMGARVWLYEATREGRDRGTSAQFVVVPERFAVDLPDGVSFDVGAALGVPAMTAHRALFADGPIEGKTVLVIGGGGGVGHMAVQLAEWGGARVITTISKKAHGDFLRAHTDAVTIDRHYEDVAARVMEETGGAGVDRIVDLDLARNLDLILAVLKPHGTVATYFSGHAPGEPLAFPFWEFMLTDRQVQLVFVYEMGRQAHDDAIRDITRALEAGKLTALVHQTYAFDRADVARAHDDLDHGRVFGKAIIEVADG